MFQSKAFIEVFTLLQDSISLLKYFYRPHCDLKVLKNWRGLLSDSLLNNKPECVRFNSHCIINCLLSKQFNAKYKCFIPKINEISEDSCELDKDLSILCAMNSKLHQRMALNKDYMEKNCDSKVIMFTSEFMRYLLPKSNYLRGLSINIGILKQFLHCLTNSSFCKYDLYRIAPNYLLGVRILSPKRFHNLSKERHLLELLENLFEKEVYKKIYNYNFSGKVDKYDDEIIKFVTENEGTVRELHNDMTLLIDRVSATLVDMEAMKEDTLNKRTVWRSILSSGLRVFILKLIIDEYHERQKNEN